MLLNILDIFGRPRTSLCAEGSLAKHMGNAPWSRAWKSALCGRVRSRLVSQNGIPLGWAKLPCRRAVMSASCLSYRSWNVNKEFETPPAVPKLPTLNQLHNHGTTDGWKQKIRAWNIINSGQEQKNVGTLKIFSGQSISFWGKGINFEE